MFAWGSTVHGELGLGGIEDEHIFKPRALDWFGAGAVKEAACSDSHTLLLTIDGKVYSCGSNDFGQLGHDQPRKRPHAVTGLDNIPISHVSCGIAHSMALNEWGHIYTWGSDAQGQLGQQLGQTIQPLPKLLKALTSYRVVQIASGQKHSIALTSGGDLYAWGANNHGQLGIGTTTAAEPNPVKITSLSGIPIAFIACGYSHTIVVSRSGAVFGWGKNTHGQLGLNYTGSKAYPSQIRSLRNVRVRYISCGDEFSTFLTLDGGVFTCGHGMYGQLGHGNTSNEILPKQVLELMGSTITQVTCGRRHTLALVPSRDKIYSFGLGAAGQLGSGKPSSAPSAPTPQVVYGPWLSPNGSAVIPSTHTHCVINRIFAGGDHCFATVTEKSKHIPSFDCRQFVPETQLLVLNYDYLSTCLKISKKVELEFLETVFKSLACFNGSFLLENEEHYCCSSRHHGVDLDNAEKTFSTIGKLENQSIKDLIWTCITDDLLNKLSPSPPDVETLRVYLVLPLYHEFSNPKQHMKVHKPFAHAVLGLRQPASKVISGWWSSTSRDYYERLVIVFKNVVAFIIRNQNIQNNKTVSYDASLVAMLDILMFLHKLNRKIETGLKVPSDTFYLPELAEYLDVRADYVLWLTDSGTNNLFLCNYPFLFDAPAKVQLLQTDQTIQMQSAMNAAAERAVVSFILQPNSSPTITQFLVLNVTREKIVADTLKELLEVSGNDLKKPLKVKFYGEEAEDAGGVKKEFFMLLLREILDPKYGMFKEYEETRVIWFSESSFEEEIMYLLIGLICGLAIYNFTIIDIPFPLALYKKLLKEPITLTDVQDLSPTIANSLKSMLDYTDPDFQEVFCTNFETTTEIFDKCKVVPLKPNGENIPVTQENKEEYVELLVDHMFNKSIEAHYEAFSKGFMKVCGGRVLKLFHSHELRSVVVGNENYDWHALEEVADYKNGYTSSDQTIRWFWEVIHEMSLEDKKKFLLFLTGSDRIPIQGMKNIKIVIQPTNDEKYLPVAHTCFNLLDLPKYKTKERLRYKLLQAIQQTQGFSLV